MPYKNYFLFLFFFLPLVSIVFDPLRICQRPLFLSYKKARPLLPFTARKPVLSAHRPDPPPPPPPRPRSAKCYYSEGGSLPPMHLYLPLLLVLARGVSSPSFSCPSLPNLCRWAPLCFFSLSCHHLFALLILANALWVGLPSSSPINVSCFTSMSTLIALRRGSSMVHAYPQNLPTCVFPLPSVHVM